MIDFEKLKNIIEQNNSFLITTHVNPDADALGSELVLAYVLEKLNKKFHIINHSSTPYNLKFLDTKNLIQKFDESIHSSIFEEVDVLFALDFNQSNRIVKMEKGYINSGKIKVCIDHHEDDADFTGYCFTNKNYSATSEILYDFIKSTDIVELDYEIALPMYAAIVTDTGSFRFDKTTPKTFRIAAELVELGVEPNYVMDSIYDQGHFSKIRLLGEALSAIQLNDSCEISYMTITQDMLKKTGANEADVDGFVNYCLSIEKVKIGILFYELKSGIKISFRSKGDIPVNKLAADFGGGGHFNASGARLYDAKLVDYIDKVLTKTKEYLK